VQSESVLTAGAVTQPAAPAAELDRSPITWVPTLYFAQGLPYFVVTGLSTLLLADLGMSDEQVTKWLSLLGVAWIAKPLWSPFLEAMSSKRRLVVIFQLLGALAMAAIAVVLNFPIAVPATIALLGVLAIASATHDIASDGCYIASLSDQKQSEFAGWQGAFYNIARGFTKGALPWISGILVARFGMAMGWSGVFLIAAATLAGLALYHSRALPEVAAPETRNENFGQVARTLWEVIVDLFAKRGIWFAILFVLLFRAGEGQLQAVAQLFLKRGVPDGGLGLSNQDIGTAYGIAGTIAFIVGSIAGGYFAAWVGLRKAMPALVVAMNLPNLIFWWLSLSHPSSWYLIAGALSVETFGYGFGFVGVILFIMQYIAPGRYPTAHYALGTGVMALGNSAAGYWSGQIETYLGYEHFFLWTLLSALPVLIMSFMIPKRTVIRSADSVEGDAPVVSA
jgi:MFS transporter, PAT family, beta-lactamase induction signal transducer AmpG